jgi:hypothetical protein
LGKYALRSDPMEGSLSCVFSTTGRYCSDNYASNEA